MTGRTLAVKNDAGRAFNVRVVRTGDKYGAGGALVNDRETMIEFYDAASKNFGAPGQFVSRYGLSTLTASDASKTGLSLNGGVPGWSVSGKNIKAAIIFEAMTRGGGK